MRTSGPGRAARSRSGPPAAEERSCRSRAPAELNVSPCMTFPAARVLGLLSVAFVVATFTSCRAVAPARRGLIPRERFFTFQERTGLRADPSITCVYFRTGDPGVIHRVATARPESAVAMRFDGPVRAWQPTQQGVLVVWGADAPRLTERTPEGDRDFVLPGGTRSVRILATTTGGDERFMLDIFTGADPGSGLYVLNLASGRAERRYAPQEPQALFFDGDLNLVAADSEGPDGGNVLLTFDAERERWHTLRRHSWSVDQFLGGFSRIVSVSRDGATVYFTSNEGTDTTRLYRFDREPEAVQELARDERVDLLPFGLSFDAANRPTSVVGLYARTLRHIVDPSWESDLQHVDCLLDGDLSFVASSRDDRRWLVRDLTGGPTRILVFDRDSRTLTFLLSEQPELAGELLATRHAHVVPSFDGAQLPVHVYLPSGSDSDGDGQPDTPLPTVLYVHGGPWVGVGHWNQSFHWRNFQLLADRGYAVVNCEFRGASGLGRSMIDKGDKAWRTGMVEDHASIARWAIAEGIAARGRVALWGWSFGGYAAMAGAAFHPDLYAAGIAMYGISDQVTFARSPFANNPFWHSRVGNPENPSDLEILRAGSPLLHVGAIKAALFLTTGALDDRIPQEQMDRMADALEDAGKEVVYSVYPEEGHDYEAADSWISFWAGAEQFLARHLGGRAQPPDQDMLRGGVIWVKGRALLES